MDQNFEKYALGTWTRWFIQNSTNDPDGIVNDLLFEPPSGGGSIVSFPADFSASSSNAVGLSLIGAIDAGLSGGSSLVVSTSTVALFTINASASSTLISFLNIIVPPISLSTLFNANSQLIFTSGTINGIIILP